TRHRLRRTPSPYTNVALTSPMATSTMAAQSLIDQSQTRRFAWRIAMRTLLASVGVVATMCVLAGCGTSTPTAPTTVVVRPNAFRVLAEASAATAPSFGACLAGSAVTPCFSGLGIHATSVTASGAIAPSAPLNLVVSSTGSSVTLAWSAPAGGDPVTTYIIEAGSAPRLPNLAKFSTRNTPPPFPASPVGAPTHYPRRRAATS